MADSHSAMKDDQAARSVLLSKNLAQATQLSSFMFGQIFEMEEDLRSMISGSIPFHTQISIQYPEQVQDP